MLSRKVNLILLLCGVAIYVAGCAHREPPKLPPPLMEDSSASGWKSY